MTSKKVSNSRSVSSLIAHILKTVGIVVTLAALLDMFLLPMPYQLGERQWQIDFVTAFVDRGIVPLIGLVLFLTGFAVDGSSGGERKAAWQDPRFWAFILASVLGVAYVLMFPWHLNNVRLANQSAIENINQKAAEKEKELSDDLQFGIESRRQQINQLMTASDDQINQLIQGGQLSQEQADLVKKFKADPNSVEPFLKQQSEELKQKSIESQRQQISQLMTASDDQINQLIQGGQLSQEQADLVKKFKADPNSVEPFLKQQQGEELQTRLQTEIALWKKQAQESQRTEDLKSGLRIGIGSLLLAIGFSIVGWTGLRNLRQM